MRANAPVYWDEAGQVWGITLYDDGERYWIVNWMYDADVERDGR